MALLLPLLGLALLACAPDASAPTAGGGPTLSALEQVVPADGLPVQTQAANNNLDVIQHDGSVFLAFRTAPSHFASADATLHVLRSTDEQVWTHEWSLNLGRDLREPRFLSIDGQLFLYFAVLGTSSLDFEPGGARVVVRDAAGSWSEPADIFDGNFIPWRARVLDGQPMVVGYTGGEGVYDQEVDSGGAERLPQIEVRWLKTDDGRSFSPFVPGAEVVHVGGGSETDIATRPGGGIVAVMRNEAGDADGWGSKICTAPAEDPGDWSCEPDPRKYDSPLVFRHGDRIWLIGRRNLNEDGAYDLGMRALSHAEQSLHYQAAYWNERKRCSLWEVLPDRQEVVWVLDLASRGDTCFASVLALDQHRYAVYNYSSPVDGPDVVWLEGQLGETRIYRQVLDFAP